MTRLPEHLYRQRIAAEQRTAHLASLPPEPEHPSLDDLPPLRRDLTPATVGEEPALLADEAQAFAAVRDFDRSVEG